MNELLDILAAETRALQAGDLRGAAALAEAKLRAVAAFIKAGEAPPRARLERLRDAIEANRAALESALALQARVVEAIARAAMQPAAGEPPGYARPWRQGAGPLAVSVRA